MANDWTLTIDVGAGQVSTDYATWATLITALSAYQTGVWSTLLYAKIKQNGSPAVLPTTFYRLFYNCRNLGTIVFEDVDTSNVTTFQDAFMECNRTVSINTETLDVKNVESFENTFRGFGNRLSAGNYVLDLSTWDTNKAINMTRMFFYMEQLRTIYAGDLWSVQSVVASTSMFEVCPLLVGAISYNSSKINHNYANWITGYFTYKAPPQPPPSKTKPSYRIGRMNSPYRIGRMN